VSGSIAKTLLTIKSSYFSCRTASSLILRISAKRNAHFEQQFCDALHPPTTLHALAAPTSTASTTSIVHKCGNRRWIFLPFGCIGSGHSGQDMQTRDSVISTRRYCCRQDMQARCPHPAKSQNSSAASSAKHRGHSIDKVTSPL
jgi:hypothetical protein